ncbi:MAG TPA: rhodanese-like domain-containing protein [Gemmatimonadales bacterium]|nr:rhodanese-like domain-containing protein [Gemmatimonadales bacterium]
MVFRRTNRRAEDDDRSPEDEGRWRRHRRGARSALLLVLSLLVLPALLLAGLLFFQGREIGLAIVQRVSARKFPNVAWIEPAELTVWREDSTRSQPLLLDARTGPEYAVSHLPGARRIDPSRPLLRHLEAFARDTPVVVYCSVGYRSARVANWLQRQGFSNVVNLSGSLFAWANEGGAMEAEGRPATQVHPYNAVWGRLLRPELRASVTPVTDPISLP